MAIGACCGIDVPAPDQIHRAAIAALVCCVILLAQALLVGWTLRRTGVALWRRKLVTVPAGLAAAALVVSLGAFATYRQFVTLPPYAQPDPWTIPWATLLPTCIVVATIVVVVVGVAGMQMERE